MEGDDVFIPLTPVKPIPPIPKRPTFHIIDTIGGQYNADSTSTFTEGVGKVLELNEAFTCIGSSIGTEYSARTGLPKSCELTERALGLAGTNPKSGVNVPTTVKQGISYGNEENVKVPPSECEDKKVHGLQKSQVGDGLDPSSSEAKSNKKKRLNDGIDLNKKPSRRPRVKKHRPKILDDSKLKKVPKTQTSTPKPKTPKRTTPNRVKKNFKGSTSDTREGVVQQVQTANDGSQVVAKSCKRSLEFDFEIINRDSHNLRKSCEEPSSFNFDHGELDIFRKIKTSKRNTGRKSRFQKKNLEASNDIKNREKHVGKIVDEQSFGVISKTECVQNSLRVYQRTFRVNECQKNSRLSRPNFPKMFKKQRTARRRGTTFATGFYVKVSAKRALGRVKRATRKKVKKSNSYWKKRLPRVKQQTTAAIRDPESSKCMLSLSPTSKLRKERSKGLTRRRENIVEFPLGKAIPCDNETSEHLLQGLIRKLENLDINGHCKELVLRGQNGALVKADPPKKRKVHPKVVLDDETLRVWKLLMESEPFEETDKNKEEWWERQREIFRGRVDSFIAKMHLILGNRRFSPWKGSVVDSVVGVYLTQNVSDHLSSSAFMSLAATYPVKSKSKQVDDHGEVASIKESIESSTGVDGRIFDNNETKQDASNSCVDISDETPITKAHQFAEVIEENIENNGHMKHSESQFAVKQKSTSEDSRNVDPVCSLHSEVTYDTKEKTVNAKTTPRKKKSKTEEKEETKIDWDELRRTYCKFVGKETNDNYMDSVDWEAVRGATVGEIAKTIVDRGMNNVLALRIKDFLERMVNDHGNIDLEWLRDVPAEKAKEFLLSIEGIGLKSVECVRLLTLHQPAFPVDTNVGRVATRLGWVPLQPLPEEVQIHLLNSYPMVDNVQKYLFPRLCTLDQRTLYELHYQLITFGKVFCTKRNPNCNACPMRGECRHYASAFASARLALPGSREKSRVTSIVPIANVEPLSSFQVTEISGSSYHGENSEPIIEVPPSPEPEPKESTPIRDIEDFDDEIPTVRLNTEEFKESLREIMDTNNLNLPEADMSKALVVLTDEAARIRQPPIKNVAKLRTVHLVYELPDSHQLLEGFDKRETDDPCPYLLAIWLTEKLKSISSNEYQEDTVKATILIPCRTANRGRFPLNGTYFQVNEVFADDETSHNPIDVPRKWIWDLNRRSLGCATSATSLFRGLSTIDIQRCFWHGFMCVRGYERKTRRPRSLHPRFHLSTTAIASEKTKTSNKLGKKYGNRAQYPTM